MADTNQGSTTLNSASERIRQRSENRRANMRAQFDDFNSRYGFDMGYENAAALNPNITKEDYELWNEEGKTNHANALYGGEGGLLTNGQRENIRRAASRGNDTALRDALWGVLGEEGQTLEPGTTTSDLIGGYYTPVAANRDLTAEEVNAFKNDKGREPNDTDKARIVMGEEEYEKAVSNNDKLNQLLSQAGLSYNPETGKVSVVSEPFDSENGRYYQRQRTQAEIDNIKEQRKLDNSKLAANIAAFSAGIGDTIKSINGAPVLPEERLAKQLDELNADQKKLYQNHIARLELLRQRQKADEDKIKAAERQAAIAAAAAEAERRFKGDEKAKDRYLKWQIANLDKGAKESAAKLNYAARVYAANHKGENGKKMAIEFEGQTFEFDKHVGIAKLPQLYNIIEKYIQSDADKDAAKRMIDNIGKNKGNSQAIEKNWDLLQQVVQRYLPYIDNNEDAVDAMSILGGEFGSPSERYVNRREEIPPYANLLSPQYGAANGGNSGQGGETTEKRETSIVEEKGGGLFN